MKTDFLFSLFFTKITWTLSGVLNSYKRTLFDKVQRFWIPVGFEEKLHFRLGGGQSLFHGVVVLQDIFENTAENPLDFVLGNTQGFAAVGHTAFPCITEAFFRVFQPGIEFDQLVAVIGRNDRGLAVQNGHIVASLWSAEPLEIAKGRVCSGGKRVQTEIPADAGRRVPG